MTQLIASNECFGVLSNLLEIHSIASQKLLRCFIHVVTFSDNRLRESYSYNGLRTLKIFDQDGFIRKLNEESSEYFNDCGCILFHQVLKEYQEKRVSITTA